MTHRVGEKGQVVIPKDLRDRLGIGCDVLFSSDEDSARVIPLRPESTLRGRFQGSGMTGRLETDRRHEPR